MPPITPLTVFSDAPRPDLPFDKLAEWAKKFVEEGAYVFITGRRQSELDKALSYATGSNYIVSPKLGG
jgi:hypothetical protein